jgi:hypothetical protein
MNHESTPAVLGLGEGLGPNVTNWESTCLD